MRVLADTHAWLWWTAEPERLGPAARSAFEDPAVTILLSTATTWEIAILAELKRIELSEPIEAFLGRELSAPGIEVLPISPRHLGELVRLPTHHRDPFDRLLIAQARAEGVGLVTADRLARLYEVGVIW